MKTPTTTPPTPTTARPPRPASKASATAAKGARIITSRDDRSGPGPEIMAADSFEGEPVVNGANEHLGKIRDVMLDVRSGRIAYAVLSSGGVLGVGNKLFAIPWAALTLDADRKCFVLNVDKERLKAAPGFDKDHWPSMADQTWASQIHTYYSIPPYWS